jgi:hypothetical protein
MSEWILLRTTNDRNGNPRAVYLEMERGVPLQVVEHGYKGIGAAKEHGFDGSYTPSMFHVTPEEYKHAVRWGNYSGRYEE